jgi:hypothetical protein
MARILGGPETLDLQAADNTE